MQLLSCGQGARIGTTMNPHIFMAINRCSPMPDHSRSEESNSVTRLQIQTDYESSLNPRQCNLLARCFVSTPLLPFLLNTPLHIYSVSAPNRCTDWGCHILSMAALALGTPVPPPVPSIRSWRTITWWARVTVPTSHTWSPFIPTVHYSLLLASFCLTPYHCGQRTVRPFAGPFVVLSRHVYVPCLSVLDTCTAGCFTLAKKKCSQL